MLNKELSFNNFCGEKYFSSLIFFSLEKKSLKTIINCCELRKTVHLFDMTYLKISLDSNFSIKQ